MKRIVFLQAGILLAVSVVCAWVAGSAGWWSALAGGLSYLFPSLIAVLLLKLFENHTALRGKAFVFGEVLKVVLSLVLMLVIFAIWHQTLLFIPFLCGLLGVSHLVFLVLLRVKDYGR